MEFLYRNVSPNYRGSQAQPAESGPLAGLGTMLGSGVTPTYRTAVGASARAPASEQPWWRALAGSPSYKTASYAADDSAPCATEPDEGDDATAGPAGCVEQALQVVIL